MTVPFVQVMQHCSALQEQLEAAQEWQNKLKDAEQERNATSVLLRETTAALNRADSNVTALMQWKETSEALLCEKDAKIQTMKDCLEEFRVRMKAMDAEIAAQDRALTTATAQFSQQKLVLEAENQQLRESLSDANAQLLEGKARNEEITAQVLSLSQEVDR